MAELISPNEIFYTTFEPTQKFRFILYIEGIPSYIVKAAGLPAPTNNKVTIDHINVQRHLKGKTTWGTIALTLYDPITPSGAQIAMEWFRLHHESVTGRDGYLDFYKKDITINQLGPVGDKIREWTCKGCFIESITFGDLDYGDTGTAGEIAVTLQPDYCILQF